MFKQFVEENDLNTALQQTLQIVAAFHDIVSYVVGFAHLGSYSAVYTSRKHERLTADWGGTEGIGAELQEIQKQIDALRDPTNPQEVGKLLQLRREVLFLQFDAAVQHLIREAFLSSGNIESFKAVTDNMSHALPDLSNSLISSIYSSRINVPEPLFPSGSRVSIISVCLCGLSERNLKIANGEILGVSLLMEDVIQTTVFYLLQPDHAGDIIPVNSLIHTEENIFSEGLLENPVELYMLLKSFLVLWKQLEVFKKEWAREKLGMEEINTLSLHQQFSKIYRVEIFYPAMKMIAGQMGNEEAFDQLFIDTQSILPLKGASEMEIKTQQVVGKHLECHMISEVQKRVAKDLTLVISERARQDTGLPIELWKHPIMEEHFSAVRPQIIEKFVQNLTDGQLESGDEVTFTKEHLKACLTSLACDIMARERSNFEAYSMFYENILQQEHHLLFQKEQAVDIQKRSTDFSYQMIVEITALRAKLSGLEEENQTLRDKIKKEIHQEYEELVQNLFLACFNLKAKLDEYHVKMNSDVCQLISEVRRESIENMITLKRKFGSTRDNFALSGNLEKVSLFWISWNKYSAVIAGAKDKFCIYSIFILRHFLPVSTDCMHSLLQKKQLLKEAEHRAAEDTRSRQHLDGVKSANMGRLQEEIGEKELKLRIIMEELEKTSKISQLQQRKIDKEIRELSHERSLKLDAFQRVDELQSQVYDFESTLSHRGSSAGPSHVYSGFTKYSHPFTFCTLYQNSPNVLKSKTSR
uniref:Uncharacterized protein n=1 Tax=Erpetoichthys calabaricus TaxID=27687 RepID=A0A8C4RF21_ERPCA